MSEIIDKCSGYSASEEKQLKGLLYNLKTAPIMAEDKMPLISIIITSYTIKRFKDICDLLNSIKEQSYPNLEVIFVAERSRELYEVVKAYAKKKGVPNFKVTFNDGERGLSASRNLGIKQADGDILAFVDDDVLLFPSWAQEMVNTYRDDSIIGVTGPALPLWEDNSMSWFPEELHWLVSCTTWFKCEEIKEVRNVWGHNFSFRKDMFEMCGLFPQSTGFVLSSGNMGFIGEDLAFSLIVKAKTGKRIVYNPAVKVWHRVYPERLSLRSVIKRAYWIGCSRRIMRMLYNGYYENILSTEYSLLKLTLLRLPLKMFREAVQKPIGSLRLLGVTIAILVSLALGYLFCKR